MTDRDDNELLAQLRDAALVADPEPGYAREAARAAFGLRDLDAQLASLVRDSADLARDPDLVLMRGVEEPRTVTYEIDDVTVDLEISESDGRLRLVGIATGVPAGDVAVEYEDGTVLRADVDDLGRFASDVPAGRARLRFGRGGDSPVVTPFTAF